MKAKGTATLLVVLILLASIVMLVDVDPAMIFPPPVPTQVYEPTMPSSDEKVVCIVFDDGWKSQLEAAKILESYNFTATFAVVTSYIGYPAYMNWADISALAQKGNDIVSHTHTHVNLSAVNYETLHSELTKSRQTLRSKGYAADVLVYPYGEGADNRTVHDIVSQYYLVARGTEEGKCNITSFERYGINAYGIYNDTTLTEFASYLNGTKGSTITLLFYHEISDENESIATKRETFQAQMQYLKENNYTTRTISQQFLKQQPD